MEYHHRLKRQPGLNKDHTEMSKRGSWTDGLYNSPLISGEGFSVGETTESRLDIEIPYRSEERRVGKECRSRWSPYH